MTKKQVLIKDSDIVVEIKKSPRAKRLSLKLNIAKKNFVLVIPTKVAEERAFDFLRRNKEWLHKRYEEVEDIKTFSDGMTFDFLEKKYVICHKPEARRGIWLEENSLMVSGNAEELGIRVERFLKKEALKFFTAKSYAIAAKLRVNVSSVRMKDTVSRWGSCSSKNNLNFNWRLGFAPLFVCDYVVAHEVVHLLVRNHSKEFWDEVRSICPYLKTARFWLKQNGKKLFCYQT
ncbi:MAG: M48 family metallopeptidase [Alphaproteobacteria bacterium]